MGIPNALTSDDTAGETVVTLQGLSLLQPLREHIAASAAPVRAALGAPSSCYVHIERRAVGTRPGLTTAVRISVRSGGERLSVYHEDPSVFSAVRDAFGRLLELIAFDEPDELSGVRTLMEA